MEVQVLNNMKFFFWSDTLQREYSVIEQRVNSSTPDKIKEEHGRAAELMLMYSDSFNTELNKVTDYLYSFLGGGNIERKNSVDVTIDNYRYTSILKGNGHVIVIKAQASINGNAYISIIFDNTERKFLDLNSLVVALKRISEKINNKAASIKIADNFNSAINDFLDYCDKMRELWYNKLSPSKDSKWFHKIFVVNGSKYVKLVSAADIFEKYKQVKDSDFHSKSAWAFIDKSNGDILKPASFSAPAKHTRANIYKKETWGNVGVFGPAYLK